MSSCYICSSPISEPRIDPRDSKLKPCGTCEAVIQDALAEFNEDGHNYVDFDNDPDFSIYDNFNEVREFDG